MRDALARLILFSLRFNRIVLLALCCVLGGTKLYAEPLRVNVGPQFSEANIAPALQVLEDSSGNKSIEQILQEDDTNWQAADPEEFRAAYSNSAFWLRVRINADQTIEPASRYMLNSDVAFIGNLDYYLVDQEKIQAYHTGLKMPYSARPYPAENFVLPLTLNPGQSRLIYIRVASEGPIVFPATLYSAEAYHQYHVAKNFVLGLFFSLCLVLGLYNLFLFFALRDYSYLYYTLNMLVICWFQASMRGFTAKFLWQDSHPAFSYIEPTLTLVLIYLTNMLFSISFLKLKTEHPRIHQYFIGLTLICIIMLFNAFTPPLHNLFMAQLYVSPILVVSSLVAAIYSLTHGNRSAR
ncbi:MAG TPA: 7TM-DISM domain-containing protein, partial [Pseudomonadales bacterium]|nr:7TM-DISM domain-containing protein [Pseudomonadales bacterium]